MRIGVMLRDIGNQVDAPGILMLNLLDQMLRLDEQNQYVLFFKDRAFFDRYRDLPRVEAVHVQARSKLLWDQLAIPLATRGRSLDLLFHPKHSLPLLAPMKTVMQLRGPEYWIHPEYYEPLDLIYQKLFAQLYARKATHLVAESNYALGEFRRLLSIPAEKISMIPLAAHERFRRIEDESIRRAATKKYGLPQRFVFTVTRVVQGKRFYGGKNLDTAIEAFLRSRSHGELKFVIAGRETRRYLDSVGAERGWPLDALLPLDFVPQEDLPTLYSLAESFLFPSRNESFGIPILEAMACGCPVLTSNLSACPETAGGAALLVAPEDREGMSAAIDALTYDAELRARQVARGYEQAAKYDWARSAEEHLRLFERLRPQRGAEI